jgi:hypothetical protein
MLIEENWHICLPGVPKVLSLVHVGLSVCEKKIPHFNVSLSQTQNLPNGSSASYWVVGKGAVESSQRRADI